VSSVKAFCCVGRSTGAVSLQWLSLLHADEAVNCVAVIRSTSVPSSPHHSMLNLSLEVHKVTGKQTNARLCGMVNVILYINV